VSPSERGRDVPFEARDGVPLVATFFGADKPRGAVLIASATGVPARFYHPFAQWLAAEQNLATLTFDYRGIAKSRFGDLAQCEATKVQWGASDMSAALDLLVAHAPGVPTHLVGNSAGGQLCGLMDNVETLSRIAQIGSSSGYLKKLAPQLRIPGTLLLKVWIPLSNRIFGYSVAKPIGWGEDLPRQVAQQWSDWCSRPGYVENGFGTVIQKHHFFDITAPVLNLSFTDDPIATDANVDDLLRLFPRASIDKRRVRPADVGMRAVGHVGYFRRSASALWPIVADFLGGDLARGLPSRESLGGGSHRS
jgi:predicted alpha/beta hydrolase